MTDAANTADLRFEVTGGGRFALRAAAIITRGDDVLMASNPVNDYLYTIGGAVAFGEDARTALLREVEEETGLRLTEARLCAVYENLFVEAEARWHEVCFFYRILLPEGVEPQASGVTMLGQPESLLWVPRSEFGIGRVAYPTFLPDLLDDTLHVRHYVSRRWEHPEYETVEVDPL